MLRPRAGETALDMPSDGGVLAAVLAGGVGHAGRVLAVDADRAAVTECAAEARLRRLRGLHPVRADPAVPPLPPGSIDVAASLFTLAHCADPAAVLASAAETLRDPGRLAVTAWGVRSGVPHLAAVESALRSVGDPRAARIGESLSMGEPGMLEALAKRVGMNGTQVLRLRDVARFDGVDHLLASLAPQLAATEAAAHAQVRGDVAAVLAVHTASDGTLLLPVEAMVLLLPARRRR